jgi:L-lactate dehydrogenase (cytochrome)
VPGGRDVAEATIARAKAAGYSALMVTIDTPVAGLRERDVRRGAKQVMSGEFLTSLPFLWQFLRRPRWLLDFIGDGAPRVFPNVELPGVGPMPAGDVGTLLEETLVTWEDLRWMRDAWRGPVIIKGVHTADDARCAMDAGADAIVVSNHGGRQLDGVPGSLRALPEVLEAVNGRIEVLMDGGIRRGADVAKALALGARAVLIGRAYAWAVGAAGGPGVARAIEILKTDLVRTMRLLGCDAVRRLDASYVEVPASWRTTARRSTYSN